MSGSLLVVDDDYLNRSLLSDILKVENYSVEAVCDGPQALEALNAKPFDLVLLDLIMPEMDGLQVLQRIRSDIALQHIPVIVISGINEMDLIARSIQMGAADYLPKPINSILLRARISASLKTKKLNDEQVEYRKRLKDYNRMLERRVQDQVWQIEESLKKLQNTLEMTVLALSSLVERRDPYTAGHQQRVSQLTHAIGKKLDFSSHRLEGLRVAAMLHDIGKVAVPAEILSKPGRLSKAEMGIVREHPEIGYEILKSIDFPWPIADMVLQHQERINGAGYPAGLTGQEMLLESKLIQVADVVEAMASHRPYRPSLGLDKAVEEIVSNSGILYDSEVVEACRVLIKDGYRF